MTCLCTNAALLCSELPAPSGAAPFLVNPSFPGLPLAGAVWQAGGARPRDAKARNRPPAGRQDPPDWEQLLPQQKGRLPPALWRSSSQTACYKSHNTEAGDSRGALGTETGQSSLSASPLETAHVSATGPSRDSLLVITAAARPSLLPGQVLGPRILSPVPPCLPHPRQRLTLTDATSARAQRHIWAAHLSEETTENLLALKRLIQFLSVRQSVQFSAISIITQ